MIQSVGARDRRAEPPVGHRLREIDPTRREDVATITRLHQVLLEWGPMARLGELFLRRFCYTVLLRDGLMRAALFEVDGRPAGFVAYTDRSITFHRQAIRRHWAYAAWLIALSVLRAPRLVPRLLRAVWLMFSRRAELHLGQEPLGEVLAIGVLPEYRTPHFVRRTALRIGEALIAHVVAYLQRVGVDRMRAVVDAPNKPALLFYHQLGGRFEPYERAGEPMVQVWFDLAAPIALDVERARTFPGRGGTMS
ncbi:MAG: GNAT family N-acetyltransferase [Candidatus Rokubacteria bacterium]|nr:GNAT family N-acetyltransferase [Candidatus Rokubacteria bacterium]